jgi:hypothetical protein
MKPEEKIWIYKVVNERRAKATAIEYAITWGPDQIKSLHDSLEKLIEALKQLKGRLVRSQYIAVFFKPPWSHEISIVGLEECQPLNEEEIEKIKGEL